MDSNKFISYLLDCDCGYDDSIDIAIHHEINRNICIEEIYNDKSEDPTNDAYETSLCSYQ